MAFVYTTLKSSIHLLDPTIVLNYTELNGYIDRHDKNDETAT